MNSFCIWEYTKLWHVRVPAVEYFLIMLAANDFVIVFKRGIHVVFLLGILRRVGLLQTYHKIIMYLMG